MGVLFLFPSREGKLWRSDNGKAGTSEGEFKEMTRAHDLHPLGIVEPFRFDLPTGEGAPLKCEGGWGEFLPGSRGEAPLVGFGAKPQGLKCRK